MLGNSLSYQANGLPGGYRVPHTLYGLTVAGGHSPRPLYCFCQGGKPTQEFIDEWDTIKANYNIQKGDVVVFWEMLNDMLQDLRTAQQTYDNAVTFCNLIRSTGAKVAIVTVIACDRIADNPNIDTDRLTVNQNVRTNYASFADVLVDVAQLSQFNALADASNGTYYQPDKTHLTDTGHDLVAQTIYDNIASIL